MEKPDQQLRAIKLIILSNLYRSLPLDELIHLAWNDSDIEAYIERGTLPIINKN